MDFVFATKYVAFHNLNKWGHACLYLAYVQDHGPCAALRNTFGLDYDQDLHDNFSKAIRKVRKSLRPILKSPTVISFLHKIQRHIPFDQNWVEKRLLNQAREIRFSTYRPSAVVLKSIFDATGSQQALNLMHGTKHNDGQYLPDDVLRYIIRICATHNWMDFASNLPYVSKLFRDIFYLYTKFPSIPCPFLTDDEHNIVFSKLRVSCRRVIEYDNRLIVGLRKSLAPLYETWYLKDIQLESASGYCNCAKTCILPSKHLKITGIFDKGESVQKPCDSCTLFLEVGLCLGCDMDLPSQLDHACTGYGYGICNTCMWSMGGQPVISQLQ